MNSAVEIKFLNICSKFSFSYADLGVIAIDFVSEKNGKYDLPPSRFVIWQYQSLDVISIKIQHFASTFL